MARCRIPPENWCGYASIALAGLGNAHSAEHVDGVLARHLLVHRIVDSVRLDDLLTHRVIGVHRRERVLKDHGHPLSAQAADILRTLGQQILAIEIDLAAQLGAGPVLLRSRPGVQAHDRQAGDALAGPGLADNAEGPATIESEAQAVDRLHQPVVGREVHPKINDLQERLLVELAGMPDDQIA